MCFLVKYEALAACEVEVGVSHMFKAEVIMAKINKG